MKKSKKLLALIIVVMMLFNINTTYVIARDEGACVHYGENFDEEQHTTHGEEETVNCSWGVSHPCYVMGKLVTCQTHYYTYRVPYYCRKCAAFLYYRYGSEMCHQYQHN